MKQPDCEASAKIKEWNYTLTLPICLHGVDMDKFALNFLG